MDAQLKRFEIRHLRLVKAIARAGGVSAAAQQLHLTQSALSHQLKVLEETLGIPLFLRHGKKLIMTEAGHRVLETADRILDEVASMQADVKEIEKGKQARLRIATECYTSFHWLPNIIPQFREQFPDVLVDLMPQAQNKLGDLLEAGELDLAIKMSPAKGKLQNQILFQDELVVVMSANHELAAEKTVSPEQLVKQHLLLCPNAKEKLFLGLSSFTGGADLNYTELPLTEAVLQWCHAGLGVSVMAPWAVEPWLNNAEIITKPLNVFWAKRAWSAVTLPQELSLPMKTFIELLQKNAPVGSAKIKAKAG